MTNKELAKLEKLLLKYEELLRAQGEGCALEIVYAVTRWVKSDKEDASE